MVRQNLLGSIVLLMTACVARADIIYVEDLVASGYDPGDQGTWTRISVAPAAGQTFEVKRSGSTTIDGALLNMHIGNDDTTIDEPVFTNASFAGGIFDAYPASDDGGGPISGFEQYLAWGVTFTRSEDTTTASGTIGTLQIDASGFTPGESFPIILTWQGTTVGGDPSSLGLSAAIISADLQYAMLDITAVPEPATWAMLLGLAVVGPAAVWRRNRNRAGRPEACGAN